MVEKKQNRMGGIVQGLGKLKKWSFLLEWFGIDCNGLENGL